MTRNPIVLKPYLHKKRYGTVQPKAQALDPCSQILLCRCVETPEDEQEVEIRPSFLSLKDPRVLAVLPWSDHVIISQAPI